MSSNPPTRRSAASPTPRCSTPAAAPGPQAVASPCINICQMHAATGWCEGCLRTIDEITAWGRLTETVQRQILAALPARQVHWQTLVDAGTARAIRRRKIGPAA